MNHTDLHTYLVTHGACCALRADSRPRATAMGVAQATTAEIVRGLISLTEIEERITR